LKEKFPITILKGLIKIYRCKDGDGFRYKVVWQTPRGKQHCYRKKLKAAKQEAETLKRKIKSGSTDNVVLDPVEQADYRAALKALKPNGTGLRVAAEEHAKAVKLLGGNHILEAARFYAKRNIHTLPKISVQEASQTFIDSICAFR
jgi:NADPH:quinone reductase-like Zn-dependent oxidoreductase